MIDELAVVPLDAATAAAFVIKYHYLHRRPPISHAFGLCHGARLVGVCTFGVPASRAVQKSVCPSAPSLAIELNRLWVHDDEPRNTETWFISRSLRQLAPLIVASYADTTRGHMGYVYRAAGWRYAGWTDMNRKTPRLDYITPNGLHSRDAFRNGYTHTVRRRPKVRYWTVTGTRADRRQLARLCGWPSLDWRVTPPPVEHRKAS